MHEIRIFRSLVGMHSLHLTMEIAIGISHLFENHEPDLGTGGFCTSAKSDTYHYILSTTRIKAAAQASASCTAHQTATWLGTGSPTHIDVNMNSLIEASFDTGANPDNCTASGSARSFINAYSSSIFDLKSAPHDYNESGTPDIASYDGGAGTYTLGLSTMAKVVNNGGYSYAQAGGYFVPTAPACMPGGGACDTKGVSAKRVSHTKVVKLTVRKKVKPSAK